MGKLATLLARLDPESGVRGRQFELICRWYLTTDPLYRRELKRVWLWDEWPGRWGADAGIDLVAEARDGGLWAIQAKAYDPRYRIKKSDVDTFLSESARPGFSFRLLIATTNEIGTTARRTLEAQEKPGHLLFLADLERAAVDWPASPSKLVGKPAKPKRPRPHQRRAIRDVVRGFEDTDRGQLIMACGTGKTLTALWIREALAAERTLVLLPSLSLLAQTLREWVANAPHEFEFLPVCSDETVTGTDRPVSKTADLGFPVTTEPAEIASFLRKRGPRVIFSTYQSSPQVAKALVDRVPWLDLAIADEAHRCAGRVSGDFATILDDRAIRAKRRLYMTATPRYFTGRVVKEAAEADLEVASMDDPARFGPVFHRLTFGGAIEQDLLSDYQVAIVVVDDATFRDYAERGVFVTTDGEKVTDARTLAAQIGLAKAMRRYDLRRIVSFHSRVAWARDFSRSLPEVIAWMPARERPKGDLWSSYVSGEMPSGHRDVLLGRLRNLGGERGLLCNARCLAEGVDVPTLDAIAFIDPRRSEVDVVQAVGRAIRKAEGKKIGTVVLPVFVGRGRDAETTITTSAFDQVWQVLNALRSHDEVLAEELDALRRELGRRGSLGKRPAKIKLLVPIEISAAFARAFDAQLVEQTTATWELWFGLLLAFAESQGHVRVPRQYADESGFRLGAWVDRQRYTYTAGTLRADRIARLDAVSGWTWVPWLESWEGGFEALVHFVEREGHAMVPAKYTDGSGFRLGVWVGSQRQTYKSGTLRADRISRLEAVPGWTWVPKWDIWELGFEELNRFVEREGHALVPATHREGGYRLGGWVVSQRVAYKDRTLSPEKIVRLESIPGWTWDALASQWELFYSTLLRFVNREGHARVAGPHVEDGLKLGVWVTIQRMAYREGSMTPERRARLESLAGWTWSVREASWKRGIEACRKRIHENGALEPISASVRQGDFRLGWWLSNQRNRKRQGKLSTARIAELEALGIDWEPIDAKWDEGLGMCERWLAECGSLDLISRTTVFHGFPIGTWLNNRRAAYRRGELPKDRVEALTSLGLAWEPRDQLWDEGIAACQRWIGDNGSLFDVPSAAMVGGFRLGQWLENRRGERRRGKLSQAKVDELDSLGINWHPARGARAARSHATRR